VLLVAIAYVPALRAGYVWDDDRYVTENATLTSLEGLRQIWTNPEASAHQFYPLVSTTFWLEYHAWGLRPFGYHAVNVLLHACAAIMLWRVLLRLAVPGAWMAAAIFALHPVHVESVAWITERKNVLSGFLYLAALLAYSRFAGIGAAAARGAVRAGQRWGWYALALGLFSCALLSKTVTASLPAAILLLLWWRRERLDARAVLPLVPMVLAGAAAGSFTAWLESAHVGAQGEEFALSLPERCLIAGRALWFYAGKLLWPRPLIFIYPRWQIDTSAWWQWVFPAAALAVVGGLWMLRSRLGKAPFVAVAFFAGSLVPALGFVNVYPMRFSFVADHFQYLASIGLIVLATAVATTLLARAGILSRQMRISACVLVLLLLSGLTRLQAGIYRDAETLWRATVERNPSAWIAYNNLGMILDDQGRLDEAVAMYSQALRLKPDLAEAHNNLTASLVGLGRLEEARRHIVEAIRLRPRYQPFYVTLAMILEGQGKIDEAVALYRKFLAVWPGYVEAKLNLASLLVQQGHREEAAALLNTARRDDE
jgi:tetratricopeptide (TPR) repeat protein